MYAMRKVILEEWVSLDGFVTDRKGQLDFFAQLTPQRNTYSDEDQLQFLQTVDTILLGRKTYQLFVDFWPNATTDQEAIADQLNGTKKFVFSNTLTKAPWGRWPEAHIVRGDAKAAIKHLKSLPGKDMVVWGSISLAQSLMQEDLIDEYHIQLCPVVTGGGRNLFAGGKNIKKLQLLEVRRYNTGAIFLSYKPENNAS